MAKGQTITATVKVNNKPTVTVSKTVELIVVNNTLVPDTNDTDPGVNTRTQ